MLIRLLLFFFLAATSAYSQTISRLTAVRAEHGFPDSSLLIYKAGNNMGGDRNDYLNGTLKADTTIAYNANTAFLPWFRFIYTYNEHGMPSEYMYQEASGFFWNDVSKGFYSYNANDSLISFTLLGFDPATYLNTKDTYTYNGSQLIAANHKLFVYPGDSAYSDNYVFYFFSGDTVFELKERRINAMWDTLSFNTTLYDTGHSVTYKCVDEWENLHAKYRNVFSYMQSKPSHRLGLIWIDSAGWTNMEQEDYLYNNAGLLYATYTDQWQDTAWSQKYSDTLIYDGNNRLVDSVWSRIWWNGSYYNNSKKAFTYNDFDQITSEKTMVWHGNGWDVAQWGYNATYYYTLHNVTPVAKSTSQLSTFPSPTRDIINFVVNFIEPVEFSVSIHNSQGIEVKRWTEPPCKIYTKAIPVYDLPTGNYYVFIQTKKARASKAFSISH